ncbi:hypothetical protein CVT26_015687 [Gymnopilus dilepis]|uniref:Uncharacterized protein n=1 Tax=Gymnopilus dilepis TaxID=231916 RepID=A0A409WMA4_9AGAR|nr:hypothetical protein CVT26_015687 [Gymnopilus dilepis]
MQDVRDFSEPAVHYYYNTPYPCFPRVTNVPDDGAVSEARTVADGPVSITPVISSTIGQTLASSASCDEEKTKGPRTSKRPAPYSCVKESGDYIRRRKRDHALESKVFTLLEIPWQRVWRVILKNASDEYKKLEWDRSYKL